MPNTTTYGKRKKSILPFFPVHKDGEKSPQVLKEKAKKRTSITISMSAFHGRHDNNSLPDISSGLDDSIEEMASMLLDDTTINELQGEPGKRISQLGSSKILPQLPRGAFSHDKTLPTLPDFLFSGEDAWALSSRPIDTALAKPLRPNFQVFNEEDDNSCPPPVLRQPTHLRKGSAPPLPLKSSKRPSRRSDEIIHNDSGRVQDNSRRQAEPRKLTKISQQNAGSSHIGATTPTPDVSPNVTQQVHGMLAASKALKPKNDSFGRDSILASKKSDYKGSKVLLKMRNAISEHLIDRSGKKRIQSLKSEQLLDPDLSHVPDYEDEPSTVSPMEIRVNEGTNFNNPKIQSLTGHGTIRRKPIADDAKLLKSRRSDDHTWLGDTHRAEVDRSLVSSQYQHRKYGSLDQADEFIQSLPYRSNRVKDEPLRASSFEKTEETFEVDFDALFSSSPVAQSTPRIRLEPSFEENGGKRLKNVPANSWSLFDPDGPKGPISGIHINTNSSQTQKAPNRKVIVKRNNSELKGLGLGLSNHISKRRKKHPSPSKEELEDLEDALKHYSPLKIPLDMDMEEDLIASIGEFRAEAVLQPKDNNMLLKETAKRSTKVNRPEIIEKRKQPLSIPSLTEPAKRPTNKLQRNSMITKAAGAPTKQRQTEARTYQLSSQQDGSLLDTDELQWDSTAYNIGMKRA